MANISCDVNINFTDEEKEVLRKAKEILDNVANMLWKCDSEEAMDMSYIFGEPADQIQEILDGHY